jgi:hypothetical protein
MYFKVFDSDSIVGKLIEEKHLDYLNKAKMYSVLYYVLRLTAGLSAALLPFFLGSQSTATALSIIIIISTVLDILISPKDRWALYSKATDLLSIAKAKSVEEFDKFEELLTILAETESANLRQLINLDDLINRIEKAGSRQGLQAAEENPGAD